MTRRIEILLQRVAEAEAAQPGGGLTARAGSLHGERSVPVLTEAQAADAPPGTTYRLPNDPPGTVRTVPGPRRR